MLDFKFPDMSKNYAVLVARTSEDSCVAGVLKGSNAETAQRNSAQWFRVQVADECQTHQGQVHHSQNSAQVGVCPEAWDLLHSRYISSAAIVIAPYLLQGYSRRAGLSDVQETAQYLNPQVRLEPGLESRPNDCHGCQAGTGRQGARGQVHANMQRQDKEGPPP